MLENNKQNYAQFKGVAYCLIDVLDIHWLFGFTSNSELIQANVPFLLNLGPK